MDGVPVDIEFQGRLWLYQEGAGSWHFVTLPKDASARLREMAKGQTKPGGSVRVTARTGATRWKTSLFFDSKRNSYLLPVKAAVRVQEQLRAGDLIDFVLMADVDERP